MLNPPVIGPEIGRGADASVHEYGEHVLKLWTDPARKQPAFIEAQNMLLAAEHGLPVPEVHAAGQYEGRWGLVMSRAVGKPLADHLLDNSRSAEVSLKAMAQLQVRMHQIRTSNLRPLKPKLAAAIASAEQLDAGLKTRLLDRLADLPDGDSLCHGDFHPYNLIGSPEALTIIDWLDAASGPAAADICRTLVILALAGDEVAEAYLVQYLALSGLTREEVLAWRPIVAAARLRENPPAIEQLLDWAAAV